MDFTIKFIYKSTESNKSNGNQIMLYEIQEKYQTTYVCQYYICIVILYG